jgi:GAF domain-containing protein
MGGAAGAISSALAVRPVALAPAPVRTTPRAVETDALLGRLCRLVRDTLSVSRATVLLFEEPGVLVPAVSVAREDHDELWQRFRAMRPIRLDVSPAAAAALRGDRVVVVDAASVSPLVPGEWRDAFGPT